VNARRVVNFVDGPARAARPGPRVGPIVIPFQDAVPRRCPLASPPVSPHAYRDSVARTFDVVLPITEDEILSRIKAYTDPDRLNFLAWDKTAGSRPLIARIGPHRVSVRARTRLINPYARELEVVLDPHETGTRVRGRMHLPTISKVILGIVFIGFFLLPLIAALDSRNEGRPLGFLLISTIFFVLMPVVSRSTEGSYRALEEFPLRCFGASVVTNDLSDNHANHPTR
jgi:hypothetical protein